MKVFVKVKFYFLKFVTKCKSVKKCLPTNSWTARFENKIKILGDYINNKYQNSASVNTLLEEVCSDLFLIKQIIWNVEAMRMDKTK